MAMPSHFTEELTLGERLARARRGVNLSQKAFAKTVGLSARSVAAYELDQRAPAFEVVVRWGKITGAPVDYFADAVVVDTKAVRTLAGVCAGQVELDLTGPTPRVVVPPPFVPRRLLAA